MILLILPVLVSTVLCAPTWGEFTIFYYLFIYLPIYLFFAGWAYILICN